jgi:hypothetical protein
MKPSSTAALLALALLAAAPAAPVLAAPKVDPAVAAAAAVPPVPEGKGQVVFFRRSSLMGMPYWTNIREDEAVHGKLSNGVYFVKTMEPGPHTFNTSVLGKDSMKIEVDPGETYYVEGKVTMAVIGYTVIMVPSDAATFQKVFKGMHPAKPVEGEAAAAPAAAAAAQ